jgi:hypothetical protein
MNEPTVQDLLARGALAEAWALAEAGTRFPSMDWRAVLAALVEGGATGERVRSCAERVVAAASASLDTWGFSEAIVAFHRIGA